MQQTPQGTMLASTGDDGTVRLWKADFEVGGVSALVTFICVLFCVVF
jgi:WD40 repeat protein